GISDHSQNPFASDGLLLSSYGSTYMVAPESSPTPAGPKEGDTKAENGYTYTYTLIPESGQYLWVRPMGQISFYPWQSLWAPDGIGVDGKPQYKSSSPSNNIGPTTVMVDIRVDEAEASVPGKHILSTLSQGFHPEMDTNVRYNQFLDTALYDGYYNTKKLPKIDFQWNTDLQDGKIAYTFYVNGVPHTVPISPQSGATIYVLPYDDSNKPSDANGFWEWSDMPYKTQFRTAFWGVNDKGIIGAIAVNKPLNELNPFEVRLLAIWHEATVVDNANKDVKGAGFSILAQLLAEHAADARSLIDIQYQQ
ncbi:MAG: hypothetical protein M1485_06325, partial [Chloroflexi bacterium]|nr:hypothetical protein [Chloroflexota bacterium]